MVREIDRAATGHAVSFGIVEAPEFSTAPAVPSPGQDEGVAPFDPAAVERQAFGVLQLTNSVT